MYMTLLRSLLSDDGWTAGQIYTLRQVLASGGGNRSSTFSAVALVHSKAGPLIPHATSSLQADKWHLLAINSSVRKARCLRNGVVLRGDPVPRNVKERMGTETGTGEGMGFEHTCQREGLRVLEK